MDHSVISIGLAIVVNLFMPRLITYVAKSSNHVTNLVIAYVSSGVVGALTAWAGGQFSGDIWQSVSLGIAASQVAYHGFWAPKEGDKSSVQTS